MSKSTKANDKVFSADAAEEDQKQVVDYVFLSQNGPAHEEADIIHR